MDIDEIHPNKAGDPLAALLVQDLDPLSVEELDVRMTALEQEIVRTKGKRATAVNHRETANMLFKS